MQQSLTQTVTITVPPGTPNTGLAAAVPGSGVFWIGLIVVLVLCCLGVLGAILWQKGCLTKLRARSRRLGALLIVGLAAGLATFGVASASAAPTLSLGANDANLSVTIPYGGGTVTSPTRATITTANPTGYTLSAQLAANEPGITMDIKGGVVAADTPLTTAAPVTLKTTGGANATADTVPITLTFHIDGTVTPGTKRLQLSYKSIDNTPVTPTTMQSMTSTYCQNNMTIYNGSNPSAILSLTDNRGGDTHTYEVAKLADGKCWMLTNLKLGSVTNSITLTSSDSNVASSFTLPQLNNGNRTADITTNPGNDYDTPYIYGPVAGDTGSGATNYGYLYNFSAATAGETRVSLPGDGTNSDNAPHDICPANWRLPKGNLDPITGGPSETNEFSNLSAHMAGFANNQDSTYLAHYSDYYQGWQPVGAFRGSFAGYWSGGFQYSGGGGILWSASALPSGSTGALFAFFVSNSVYPGFYGLGRESGFGIRCLLR